MSLLRRAAQRLSTAAVAASSSSSSSSSSVLHHPRHHQRLSPLPLLLRHHSNKPVDSVYGGPRPPIERTTLRKLASKYRRGERISVVTAYDYPSAVHVDLAGIDVCLVGDSAAMVVHGQGSSGHSFV